MFLPEIDPVEPNINARHDREAALGSVGDGREGIDCRDFKRQVDTAASGEFGGEHKEVRWVPKRGECPGEDERKGHSFDRVGGVGEFEHLILEPDHDSGVYFKGQMEIEWAAAGIFRVEVDLPGLTHGIGLDEMSLVVHMEGVVDCVIFEIGYETRYIDNCHVTSLP
ncbi:hypothetical protein MCETE7_00710 [Acidimicrobiia bacterium]